MLCLALMLGACTSGDYYSSATVYAAHGQSRPYTYPSSGTTYSGDTASRYSRSNGYPAGATVLPHSTYYYRYPDYPRGIYYGQAGDYRPYEYYRPYQFYRPYQYYRHRPYNYYRYRPHLKKDRGQRAGKPYRSHRRGYSTRPHARGDLRLRRAYRIQSKRDVRGNLPAHSTLRKHREHRAGMEHHLQQRYRKPYSRRAHQGRRAVGTRRAYRGHLRHGTEFRGHSAAGPGRRR